MAELLFWKSRTVERHSTLEQARCHTPCCSALAIPETWTVTVSEYEVWRRCCLRQRLTP